jgi:hypothetical protein
MAQDDANTMFVDFMYPKYLMRELFDISITDANYIEKAYRIFREIGNIASCTHAITTPVSSKNIIELPCNCEFIESVSAGTLESDGSHDDLVIFHDDKAVHKESQISLLTSNTYSTNLSKSQLNPPGEFVPYEVKVEGEYKYLSFSDTFTGIDITVIYRGIMIDDDGNPLLTIKEATAIAFKCAYEISFKEAFKGSPIAQNALALVANEYGRKMQAAKLPEYLSQNFIDRMLSAKTRHDRKVFYSSYKTMQ